MARRRDPVLEQERRALVMDTVVERLATGSWRTFTLDEVARTAGVSKGMVTYWFPSKDALFVETIRRYHTKVAEQLLGIASEPMPARDRVARLVETAFPDRDTVEKEVRFQTEVWTFAKEHPEALAEVRGAYVQSRLAIEVLLEIGAGEGYVTNPQREGLAIALQALVDGFSLQIAFDPTLDVTDARQQLLGAIEALVGAPAIRPG